MKRILITGTNGFLANRLIDFCEGNVFGISRSDNHKAGKKCTTFYGDILDIGFLKRIIGENEPDVIYHLAAQSIVRIANSNPDYAFRDNIMGTVNVLEAVRQINPKIKIVCASSDKCYGEHETLPYLEDFALKSGDPYSTSKACGDLVAQSYHKTYGLNINIVRSANIYGAGDMNLSRLIPNTITKILRKEKPVIYSGVMQYKREFIYVDDVCGAYKVISEKGISGEAYNVGTGQVFKVADIVETICDEMNWGGGIDIIEKSFPEITTQYLSSDKIKQIGWKPSISIEDGIKKTINWYTNIYTHDNTFKRR
jgi:CDP-glucose 4,6-dehydratase